MFTTLEHRCAGCGDPGEIKTLELCTMCHKYFCIDCAVRSLGRRFCSVGCAEIFFHGDSEDGYSDNEDE